MSSFEHVGKNVSKIFWKFSTVGSEAQFSYSSSRNGPNQNIGSFCIRNLLFSARSNSATYISTSLGELVFLHWRHSHHMCNYIATFGHNQIRKEPNVIECWTLTRVLVQELFKKLTDITKCVQYLPRHLMCHLISPWLRNQLIFWNIMLQKISVWESSGLFSFPLWTKFCFHCHVWMNKFLFLHW